MPPTHSQSKAGNSASPAKPIEQYQELILVPAISLLVFVRRDVGFLLLEPRRLTSAFMSLQLYALVIVPLLNGAYFDTVAIEFFAIAFAVTAFAHRRSGWKDINRGARRHSLSTGTSPLERRCRLRYLLNHRRVYRYAEPIVNTWVSGGIFLVFHGLGMWLFSLALITLDAGDERIDREPVVKALPIRKRTREEFKVLWFELSHLSKSPSFNKTKDGACGEVRCRASVGFEVSFGHHPIQQFEMEHDVRSLTWRSARTTDHISCP
jgi:hypothetical protein